MNPDTRVPAVPSARWVKEIKIGELSVPDEPI